MATLLLCFTFFAISFANPQPKFYNSTTTAPATSTPSCGPCAIAFEPLVWTWDTYPKTINQTIATKLIIVDNATDITSVSSSYNTIIDASRYGVFNRDGTAISTLSFTDVVNGSSSVDTTVITSPTPFVAWVQAYNVVGPTLTSVPGWGFSCVTNVLSDGTDETPLPSKPTYAPTGIELQSIAENFGADARAPQGLSAEFSTLSDFQKCTAAGPLQGEPQTLVGAAFLTETTTIYQAASSPKAPVLPVQSTELSHVSDSKVGGQPPQQASSPAKPSEMQTATAVSLPVMVKSVSSAEVPPSAASQTPPPQPIQTSIDKSSPSSAQGPQSIFGDGSSNGVGILPSNIASAAATVSIGNKIVTVAPAASAITIGDQIITAGSPAITAAGGIVVSLSPSDSILVVAGNSITLGAIAAQSTGPTNTIAGSPPSLPSASSSITTEDATPAHSNLPVTIPGTPKSHSSPSKILLFGGSSITALPSMAATTPLAQLPPQPPIITIAGSPVTLLPTDSALILAGHTLTPGRAPITISGTPISYSGSASSQILLLGGSTITILPFTATTTPSAQFPTQSPVIVIAGSPVTLLPTGSTLILAGQTLTPGGPAVTISGTPVSLAPSANYILVGGTSSIPIPLTLAPTLEYITVGTQVFTATRASNGDVLVSGQTLVPGGEGATIGGTLVSLVSGAQGTEVVVGSATEGVGLGGYILGGIAGGWGTLTATGTRTSTATGAGAEAGTNTGTGSRTEAGTSAGTGMSTGSNTGTVDTGMGVSTGAGARCSALTRWGLMVMGSVMFTVSDCCL